MTILTVGIDTAKNMFAVHGVDEYGKVQLRQPKVSRAKLNDLVASLPPCTIGIEACTGSHHWARLFQARRRQQDRFLEPLGRERSAAPRLLEGRRGGGSKERAHGLGRAHQG